MDPQTRTRRPLLSLTTAALALALGLTGCTGGPQEAASSAAASETTSAAGDVVRGGAEIDAPESAEPLSNARAAAEGDDRAASARASHEAAASSEATAVPRHAVVTLPAALFETGGGGMTFDAWARTTDAWQADGSDPRMPDLGGWDPKTEPVVAEAVLPADQDSLRNPGVLTVPVSGPGVTHRLVLLCEHTSPRRDEETAGVDVVAGETHAAIASSLGCTPIDVRHTVRPEHIVDGAVRYEFQVAPLEAGRLAVLQGR